MPTNSNPDDSSPRDGAIATSDTTTGSYSAALCWLDGSNYPVQDLSGRLGSPRGTATTVIENEGVCCEQSKAGAMTTTATTNSSEP